MAFFGKFIGVLGKMMISPAVKFIKTTLSNNYHPTIENFFYTIGKQSHRIKMKVESFTMREKAKNRPREIERAKLVEYGAEIFFGTFCTYAIAIYYAIKEIKKSIISSKKAKENTVRMNNLVLGMKEDIYELQKNQINFTKFFEFTQNELLTIKNQIAENSKDNSKKINELTNLIQKEISNIKGNQNI